MKRMTIRNGDGSVSQPIDTTFEAAMYRLADYEDTGLEPKEIKEFMEAAKRDLNELIWIGGECKYCKYREDDAYCKAHRWICRRDENCHAECMDYRRRQIMAELKPCPFCGCGGAGTKWHHGYWSVACGYLHDGTPSNHCFQDWGEFETEDEAKRAWNRRTKNDS